MAPDIEQQLIQLATGQAAIMRRLDEMNGSIRAAAIEIGGIETLGRDPNRLSLRRRLHKVENDRAAADAATAAVSAAKELRASVGEKRFSRREKSISLVLAALVSIGPYITLFLHH